MSSIIAIEGRGYLPGYPNYPFWIFKSFPLGMWVGLNSLNRLQLILGLCNGDKLSSIVVVGTSCEDVIFKRTAPLTQSIGVTFASPPISARHNFAYNYSCNVINPLAFQSIGKYLDTSACNVCNSSHGCSSYLYNNWWNARLALTIVKKINILSHDNNQVDHTIWYDRRQS